MATTYGHVVIVSTLFALFGVVLQPARRILEDWNFQLSRDAAGLRLRHGLIETRSQVVPLDRVQAIGVTWPLLWRPKRWLRLRIDVAGYGRPDGERGGKSDRLLPVGDMATARRLVAEVLPGVDLLALPLTPPPERAAWLAPLARPILTAGLGEQVFGSVEGLLTRRLVVLSYARIQSVRLRQGPLDRRLRLATVYADSAGSLTAVARHRDIAEARWLAAELTARAREARRLSALPPPLGRPHDEEREPHVDPADEHVDEVVLTGVDEGEGHGERVRQQERPPPLADGAQEEHDDEERERRMQ